jgi:hypothetical protein
MSFGGGRAGHISVACRSLQRRPQRGKERPHLPLAITGLGNIRLINATAVHLAQNGVKSSFSRMNRTLIRSDHQDFGNPM